jgi:hypothetical protein
MTKQYVLQSKNRNLLELCNPWVGLLTHVDAGTDTDLHDVHFVTHAWYKLCAFDLQFTECSLLGFIGPFSQYMFFVMIMLAYSTLPGTRDEWSHIWQLLIYGADYHSSWCLLMGNQCLYYTVAAHAFPSQHLLTEWMSANLYVCKLYVYCCSWRGHVVWTSNFLSTVTEHSLPAN